MAGGAIMETQKFQVELSGSHPEKFSEINKAVPVHRENATLHAPELCDAQGKQSSFFLEM